MQLIIKYQEAEYPLSFSNEPVDAADFIEQISRSDLPQVVKNALTVRLADPQVNMFGRTMTDEVTTAAKIGETRYSVQVHPYPWQPSGASNVVVYQNAFNELSVALVYNQRRDRRPLDHPLRKLGVPSDFRLPEGYMHPKPCPGGENGIAVIESDNMDEAEELILKKVAVDAAYKQIQQKQEPILNILFHKDLAAPSLTPAFDKTVKECALRELKEEINFTPLDHQVHFSHMREENAVVGVFLIKTNDDATAPELQVDGLEIKEAMWGKLKAFKLRKNANDNKLVVEIDYYDDEGDAYPVEVPHRYALTIGQCIQLHRNQELQAISQTEGVSLFTNRESVEAKLNHLLRSKVLNPTALKLSHILGESPENTLNNLNGVDIPGENAAEKSKNATILSNLGQSAENYHHKLRALAKLFTESPADKIYTAQELIFVLKECSSIEQNRSYAKLLNPRRVSI